jgi:hypothetical protein
MGNMWRALSQSVEMPMSITFTHCVSFILANVSLLMLLRLFLAVIVLATAWALASSMAQHFVRLFIHMVLGLKVAFIVVNVIFNRKHEFSPDNGFSSSLMSEQGFSQKVKRTHVDWNICVGVHKNVECASGRPTFFHRLSSSRKAAHMHEDSWERDTRTLLAQLLHERSGSQVGHAYTTIVNRREDYVVLLATLRHPTLSVVVKLAGPPAPYP